LQDSWLSGDPPLAMKKTLLLLVGLLSLPAIAEAQATIQLSIGLPVVLPALVVVQPGVQVVPDVDHEVFFVDGWYYTRHEGGWYRAHDHRGGWVMVPPRAVPARIVSIPAGRYRRYHPAEERREERREVRHEERREEHHDHGRHEGHGRGRD
jgi:hypothetical protein